MDVGRLKKSEELLSKFNKFGNPAHGHAARHAKRGKRGKSIKWPSLYDHLRDKGYSRRKAAMISNGKWRKKMKRGPKSIPGTKGLAGLNKSEYNRTMIDQILEKRHVN